MDTTAKPHELNFSAAWTTHTRERRKAIRAVVNRALEILLSINRRTGIKDAVYSDEVRMGQTVLFRAVGQDFVVTLAPELLYKPLLDPLMKLIELSGDVEPEVNGNVAKIVTEEQAQKFSRRAELLRLLNAAYDLLTNLNTHQSIKGGEYVYQVKIGADTCLIEARGSDYAVDESFGLLLRDIKAPIFDCIEVIRKGSGIPMFEADLKPGDKLRTA